MATNGVVFIHSGMAGAPVLSGSAGALLNVLTACLVDGFNSGTLSSLAVASNVATGTRTSHGYVVNQVVEISGATPSGLNGKWFVTSVTTDTFSFATSGISDQTATGTISVKTASAGWNKPYSGTNKAVFRSADATSNKACVRIEDTGTTMARVVGYESMTDVDTGSGPFPTAAQVSGGTYWLKSQSADSAARAWQFIGDGRSFYFLRTHNTSPWHCIDGFIEYVSEKPGDAYNFMLTGCFSTTALSNICYWSLSSGAGYSVAWMRTWGPRAYTQIGSAIELGPVYANYAGATTQSGNGGMTYPSPLSNGIILSKCTIANGGAVRCREVPGLLHSPQNNVLAHMDVIEDVPGLEGRKIVALQMDNTAGRVFFDITGPWQ